MIEDDLEYAANKVTSALDRIQILEGIIECVVAMKPLSASQVEWLYTNDLGGLYEEFTTVSE
jgi:hypothetical protein